MVDKIIKYASPDSTAEKFIKNPRKLHLPELVYGEDDVLTGLKRPITEDEMHVFRGNSVSAEPPLDPGRHRFTRYRLMLQLAFEAEMGQEMEEQLIRTMKREMRTMRVGVETILTGFVVPQFMLNSMPPGWNVALWWGSRRLYLKTVGRGFWKSIEETLPNEYEKLGNLTQKVIETLTHKSSGGGNKEMGKNLRMSPYTLFTDLLWGGGPQIGAVFGTLLSQKIPETLMQVAVAIYARYKANDKSQDRLDKTAWGTKTTGE